MHGLFSRYLDTRIFDVALTMFLLIFHCCTFTGLSLSPTRAPVRIVRSGEDEEESCERIGKSSQTKGNRWE